MPALDDAALDQLFRTARSYNGYTDQPVSEDELRAIWDLMRMGPTSANQLPARIVWCTSADAKEKLAACCSEQNAPKVLKAPVAAIIAMDTEFHEQLAEFFPHAPSAREWFAGEEGRRASAVLNTSLQVAYFIMAARALGLDTGPMTGFDAAAVDRAFFADQPALHALVVSTLGHGDPASIFDRLPRPSFDRFNRIA